MGSIRAAGRCLSRPAAGAVESQGYDERMVELTVIVSEETAEHLAERARAERTTPQEIASRALRSFLGPDAGSVPMRPRFIGLGHSGRGDVSERAEEILRADLGA